MVQPAWPCSPAASAAATINARLRQCRRRRRRIARLRRHDEPHLNAVTTCRGDETASATSTWSGMVRRRWFPAGARFRHCRRSPRSRHARPGPRSWSAAIVPAPATHSPSHRANRAKPGNRRLPENRRRVGAPGQQSLYRATCRPVRIAGISPFSGHAAVACAGFRPKKSGRAIGCVLGHRHVLDHTAGIRRRFRRRSSPASGRLSLCTSPSSYAQQPPSPEPPVRPARLLSSARSTPRTDALEPP